MSNKNQNGIIAIFVLFVMIIFLVFTIIVYYSVKSKSKMQNAKTLEYKEIYSKNSEEINNIEYASSNEIIPIYNIDELDVVGTNNFLQIKNKIYECGREKSYVLKDNIIVDIEEKVKSKVVGFNDFKLYSSTYFVDKALHDLYYYGYGKYWKCIAYKKYNSSQFSLKDESYTDKEFLILNELILDSNKEYDVLIIWSDEQGELLNEESNSQRFGNSKISSIYELSVFNKNQKNFNDEGEYYIFISIGDSI